MKGESKNEQKTLALSTETECIRFLESLGLDVPLMFLGYWEKWQLKKKQHLWELPTFQDIINDPMFLEFEARNTFINKYGFAILHRAAIEAMRPYAPLLEIGAGSGYWTYELRKYGVDCIATDNMTSGYGFFHDGKPSRWRHHYTTIEILNSVEAVRKYPNRTLLTVWPDYDETWASDALDIYTGQTVIYMGEGHGNATADDRFHELLDTRFGDQEAIPMHHFEYSYDRDLLICKQPKQLTKGDKQNEQ